jgi:predicted TIM-barrel fold metal-dependent hydrolase
VAHKNPNVWLDMSGLISNTTKSRGRHEKWRRRNADLMGQKIENAIIELSGVEKIIFGTDWPISSHEAYLALIDQLRIKLGLNRMEKDRLMKGNILKVLGVRRN